MNALALATMPPDQQQVEEEEDRERNTSTRSPDSLTVSPVIDPLTSFVGVRYVVVEVFEGLEKEKNFWRNK